MSKPPTFTYLVSHNSDVQPVKNPDATPGTGGRGHFIPAGIPARWPATIALIVLLAGSAGAADAYEENPGADGDGKVTSGPDYQIDPDLTERGNPKGKSFEFTMPLADSKIFRGDDSTLEPEKKAVRKERKIFVYVPATYEDGAKAPILVI